MQQKMREYSTIHFFLNICFEMKEGHARLPPSAPSRELCMAAFESSVFFFSLQKIGDTWL